MENTDGDGRIKRFFCDILKLRVVAYVVSQPPSFVFVLSVFLLATCMPLLASVVRAGREVPDLDSMREWNSYLGSLAEESFCLPPSSKPSSTSTRQSSPSTANERSLCDSADNFNRSSSSVGVEIDFLVPAHILADLDGHHLFVYLNGTQLKTKLKDEKGRRIDEQLTVRIDMHLNKNNSCTTTSGDQCSVSACVVISSPRNAIPVRKPPVLDDFSFQNKVLNPKRGHFPNATCECVDLFAEDGEGEGEGEGEGTMHQMVLQKELDGGCASADVIKPAPVKYRHHGLIVIYLNQDDLNASAFHLLLTAVVVLAVGLAVAVSISCTDRPRKPKASAE